MTTMRSFQWWLLALMLAAWQSSPAAEVRLPELKTRTASYTNVVVTSRTANDIYISHDGGIGNIKISDIEDDAALIALGFKAAPVPGQAASDSFALPAPIARFMATNQPLQLLKESPAWSQVEKLREVKWTLPLLLGLGCGALLVYLFSCHCLKLICVKAGHEPGALVWIPILQMIPMFRAAGMSGWWLLACLVPLLNLVAVILWSFKIARARGKGVLVALALLLPVLNLLAFLYLAFSGTSAETSAKLSTPPDERITL